MEIIDRTRADPAGERRAMGGYLARPRARARIPRVIVFMEIFGVNSHIRDVTERVAREGYVALAPGLLPPHRRPASRSATTTRACTAGMKQLKQLDADEMIADARAALRVPARAARRDAARSARWASASAAT